jgi:hypothetical protein
LERNTMRAELKAELEPEISALRSEFLTIQLADDAPSGTKRRRRAL